MKIKLLLSAILCMAMVGCKTPTKVENVYARVNFEVECLGVDHDGSQTLRSFGKGKNKAQAMETARKNAVRAVLFKGITAGTSECNTRPIINVVNAEEKNEGYFNRFFSDGGAFEQYTSLIDEKRTSRIKSSDKALENWGIVVRVDRAGLKERMIKDGIINP
ncbi:MAG: hypothetical protein K2H86_01490 [Muribaculaceae bacterium]|nr:hypothetical protein [Muribaculaceae bacterium]